MITYGGPGVGNTTSPAMYVAVDGKRAIEKQIGEVSGFANKQNITALVNSPTPGSTVYRYPFFEGDVCYIFPFVNIPMDSVTIPSLAHYWGTATINNIVCDVWYAHPFQDEKVNYFYFVGPQNSLVLVSSMIASAGTPFPKTIQPGSSWKFFDNMVYGPPTPAQLNMSLDGCYNIATSGDSADAYASLLSVLGRDKATAASKSYFEQTPVNDEKHIENINAKATTWKAGANPRFQGMTLADAQQLLGWAGAHPNPGSHLPTVTLDKTTVGDLPDSFDARTAWPQCASVIGGIRDQGQCGSCWAFGQAESLSDRFCIASNGTIQVVLSPQFILDCDTNDYGCGGGFVDVGWDATLKNGIASDACVPYTAGQVPCDSVCADGSPIAKSMYTISAAYTPGSDPAAIQREIMANGPIEAAFEVYEDFFSYVSGVYQVTPGSAWAGGHGIKVLGWGVDAGVPYWICANSWATSWGDQGFFNILRGSNNCAFEMEMCTGTPVIPSL